MAEFARVNINEVTFPSTIPLESELLKRILLAFTYGTGAASSKSIFHFCFENVFDLFEPVSCAMWKYEPDDEWSLWVKRGAEMSLPNGHKNWGEANRASMLSRQTNSISHADGNGSKRTHMTSPVILRGESCYVLHLVTDGVLDLDDSLSSFMQSLAYLIVNFKFMDGHSNSNQINDRVIDIDGNLSNRQKEILQLIARDMTYQQIANRVGYSESTVKQEAMKIFRKLGVHNRNDVVRSFSK